MDHTSLDSMMEQYICEEGEYRMKLDSFWDLTKNVTDTLKGLNSVIECIDHAEVTDFGDSNQFIPYFQDDRDDSDASTILSSRRCSESTQCVLNDNVSLSESRGIADDLISGEIEAAQSMMRRESEELDQIHKSRSVTVRVLPGGSVKAVPIPHPVVNVESIRVPPESDENSSAESDKPQNADSFKSNEEQ